MNGPYFFNEMIIDEIRISDISRYGASDYNDEEWESDENTIALYKFNTGSGDILYDHSGNANHGTINGATWEENVTSITGCTDPYANNYDPAATIDDGSCTGYPDKGTLPSNVLGIE